MSSASRRPLIRIRTLRGRLTVWHLTTLALTLGAFAALLHGAVSRSLYEHHDGALRRQAADLAGRLRNGALTMPEVLGAIAASASTPRFVMLRNARGELLFEEAVSHSNEPSIGQHEALVHAARNNANVPEFFTASLETSGAVRFICVPLGRPGLFLQLGDRRRAPRHSGRPEPSRRGVDVYRRAPDSASVIRAKFQVVNPCAHTCRVTLRPRDMAARR